ncbi:hypothetical protein ACXIVC_21775 [Vibrio parahaemolyticus]
MSFLYTASQRECARESLIAAYVGVSGRHTVTLDESVEVKPITLKKPSQETHLTVGREKRRGRSIPLISDRHFEQARLLKQVNLMSPLAVAWVEAAYHSKNDEKLKEMITAIYHANYRVRSGTESLILEIIDISIKKSLAAVQDVITITDAQIAVHLGRSRRAYRDNWKSKVDFLCELMSELDIAIIEHVCAVLDYQEYAPSIKPKISVRDSLIYTSKHCAIR